MLSTGSDAEAASVGNSLTASFRVRAAVLDTGPLTCDVINAARSGLPSPLSLAMRLGVVRGFAASHVWAEVPRVLQKRAPRTGVPFTVLERLWWDEYVPLIRFVDCAGLPVTEQAVTLAGRDPSDSATLVLAGLLAPVVIIAEDKDILASGLAYEQWRHVYRAAGVVAEGNSQLRGAAMGLWLAGYGLMRAGKAFIRAARNPWLLGAAGLGVLLLSASAGAWTPRLRASWRQGATGRREIQAALGEALQAAVQRLHQAEATWRCAERGTAGTTLIHQVAAVLAVAEAPTTDADLAAALGMADHDSAMIQLAALLNTYAAFHEVEPHRWQLGREKIDFGGLPATVSMPNLAQAIMSRTR